MWSDGAVTLYDAAGRAVQELNAHRAPVRDVRVLPGGRTAVTAGDGGQVELWNVVRPTVTGRSASPWSGTRLPSSRSRSPPTAGRCSPAPPTASW